MGIENLTLLVQRFVSAKSEWIKTSKDFGFIILGAAIISPLVSKLPFVGWDWYFFFTNHSPTNNLLTTTNPYPPFTHLLLSSITWMDWKSSQTILNAITLMTLALFTWKFQKSYLAIILAIFNPIVYILFWVGHPDGLVLLGIMTGFIPLIIIKPQIALWSVLSSKRLIFWTILFIISSFLIWGFWPMNAVVFAKDILLNRQVLYYKEATYGWGVLGWPVFLIGVLMLAGAGQNKMRLIAAGSMLSPYVMPYHMVLLLPVLGEIKGTKKILVWASIWFLFLATGLKGPYKYLNLVFPILAYFLSQSPAEYINNAKQVYSTIKHWTLKIIYERKGNE